jgi:peptidoglycan/xylan/chitin deacetylase (PgdA/CDA1 family)
MADPRQNKSATGGSQVGGVVMMLVVAVFAAQIHGGGRESIRGEIETVGEPRAVAVTNGVAAILAYHRFGRVVSDSMTIRTATLRWQLTYLKEHGYSIVPLRALVAHLRGEGPALPPRAVVLTVDDGHLSVYTELFPIARQYALPITLFIYPSAISNASYAMTWEQLRELNETGLFDLQSHTYWHPNFAVEKRRLAPAAYRAFVASQLSRPPIVLAERLGVSTDLLAWPFGIYDDELLRMAADCGYLAGVTLDRHLVRAGDPLLALPRFLMTDRAVGSAFAAMLPKDQR